MVNKDELRQKFSQEWRKYYLTEVFESEGFVRKQCKLCGRYFWTLDPGREVCGDPEHSGYTFVGSPVGKRRTYTATWVALAEFYARNGHTILPRYPVVARWRDDLYFTIASIAVFQPYVVRGEVDPPANPLLIPQPCLRFNDVDNVGLSGRHMTSFVMVGQHAFNKDEMVLWKNEAVEQMYRFLTEVLKLPKEEITFHEDVWAGGGNFGPSLEYFARGLELGNIVFMQFEETENGAKELTIKVIDHGIGLARMAWITNGSPTVYDVVFPTVMGYLREFYTPEIPPEVLNKFYRLAGMINFDEVEDFAALRRTIERETVPGILEKIRPMAALYAIADHTRTLLFAASDGAFPSNVRGGYNLRAIARRSMYFVEKYGWDIDWARVFELHAKDMEEMFPELAEAVPIAIQAFEEEKKKFQQTLSRGKRKVLTILKTKGKLDKEDYLMLYQSHGVPPEVIEEITGQPAPPGIYAELRRVPEKKEKAEKTKIKVPEGTPPTDLLYYKDPYLFEFTAKVVGIWENWVFLDKTAFYPEGGGQEADRGTLNDVQVLDVQKVGQHVAHLVEDASQFKVGELVVGKVDERRRRALMRHHTSAHIILAAARRVLGKHVWQEGAHKAEDVAHIDISHFRSITPEELAEIEREANKIVMENSGVRTYWMGRIEAEQKFGIRIYQGGAVPGAVLRIVEIPGVDVEACGGTHVSRTGEIGLIKIVKRESVADGVERIIYKAGEKAVEYIQELECNARKAAEIARAPVKELAAGVKKLLEKFKAAQKDKERLMRTIAELAKDKSVLVLPYFDPAGLRFLETVGIKAVISLEGAPNVFLHRPPKDLLDELRKAGFVGGGKEWVVGKMDPERAKEIVLRYFSQRQL